MDSQAFEQVYYAQTSNADHPLNLIAIRPKITGTVIEWEDTSWGTRFEAQAIKVEKGENDIFPNKIIVTLKDGETITLTKLVLENYNKNVRHWVAGKISFQSDEELQKYYLKTIFGM